MSHRRGRGVTSTSTSANTTSNTTTTSNSNNNTRVVVRKGTGTGKKNEGLGYLKTREIAARMKEGVSIADRKWRLKTYEHCFVAKEAVSWLLKAVPKLAKTRPQAVAICKELASRGFIHHVVDPTRTAEFEDKYLFYK